MSKIDLQGILEKVVSEEEKQLARELEDNQYMLNLWVQYSKRHMNVIYGINKVGVALAKKLEVPYKCIAHSKSFEKAWKASGMDKPRPVGFF